MSFARKEIGNKQRPRTVRVLSKNYGQWFRIVALEMSIGGYVLARNKKYLLQGDMDGACFLYSIANAKVALQEVRPNLKQWGKALKAVPFSSDFLDGNVGTLHFDSNLSLLKSAVEVVLCAFKFEENVRVKCYEKLKHAQLKSLLSKDTAVILVVNEGAHWVCAVDVDQTEGKIYCACSDQGDSKGLYEEKRSKNGRLYNRVYDLNAVCFDDGGIGVSWRK